MAAHLHRIRAIIAGFAGLCGAALIVEGAELPGRKQGETRFAREAHRALLSSVPTDHAVVPLGFPAISGWAEDDHAAAFQAFGVSCAALSARVPPLRPALAVDAALAGACAAAAALQAQGPIKPAQARAFFETHFAPYEIRPPSGSGFLTGYFEPEAAAALLPSPEFSVPVLARPPDLVTLAPGETPPGLDPALAAARRQGEAFVPFPDRAAIWAGALAGQGLEIAWLRDHADLFIIQVQGSARLVLPDGTRTRLVYAGRNDHAYTSIGRKLVEQGEIPLESMRLSTLMAWLRADPVRGRRLMEQNRSYIFFALEDGVPAERGPIGGAGLPLSAGRSLAIDRHIWPYHLPIFIEASPLAPAGGRARLARLVIAQDTGSAIIGAARGDFFVGSGEEAGIQAGLIRDSQRFIVLAPNGEGAP